MHKANGPQKLAVRIAYDKAVEKEQAPESKAMDRGQVSRMIGYLKYHGEDGQAQVQLCLFIRILLLAFLLNIIKRIMIIIIIIAIVIIIIININIYIVKLPLLVHAVRTMSGRRHHLIVTISAPGPLSQIVA